MELKAEYSGLPYDLVIDGIIQEDNLQKISKDKEWLKKQVAKFGILPEEALIVTIDGKGNFFCQEKMGKRK